VRSQGELGLLAASFNDMTRSLRRTKEELRALQVGLEHQVEERTSDLRAAQAALVQSEKLSSLGRLSASIAHEINNPLAGILTFAKLILREVDMAVPDEARRMVMARTLGLVQRETERCSAIVHNLLDFARERPLELREVDLNVAVEESLQLVAHQIAIQGHQLDRRLGPVAPVRADFGQLRQAIVNVILNGCEAMQKGGRLTVATGRSADGQAVEVAIGDTGPGIAPEHLPHIFDPFFSTKEKGTGLGLSVVYGIIQRHGGTVLVKSEVGKGTTFTIRLPAVRAPEA
jgi:two-component system NtrC family sensor kinase